MPKHPDACSLAQCLGTSGEQLLSYTGLSSFLNNTAFHFPAIYSLINAVENLKWSVNYNPSVPQTVITSLHWLELSYFLHRLKLATDFVT